MESPEIAHERNLSSSSSRQTFLTGLATSTTYKWSSYTERINFGSTDEIKTGKAILDIDSIFLSLGETNDIRLKKYKEFAGENIAPEEIKFLRDSVKRGQLTGNTRFEEAVEQIIGKKISGINKSYTFIYKRSILF